MESIRSRKRLHEPALLPEVLEALKVSKLAHSKKAYFIDATLGLGGHTIGIISQGGFVLGIETDRKSLEIARKRVHTACPSPSPTRGSFTLVHGNFKDIDKIAKSAGFSNVDGVLFDLGVSSYQLLNKNVGLSFQNSQAPLDMRLDRENQSITAADLLRVLDEAKLTEVFNKVLDAHTARKLAREIVKDRREREIKLVEDFVYIIQKVIPARRKLNKATLPFLALRMSVNSELENLKETLPKAFSLLKKGGRLVIITFHSGEDKLVKEFFRLIRQDNEGKILTKKPVLPAISEFVKNPRARSAKMRVIEKI